MSENADLGTTTDQELMQDIRMILNRASRENASDTPDYVLAAFLLDCLKAYEEAIIRRGEHANGS